MKLDLTDITLVVDRSGSMQAIQADAEGGVNAFIERQAKEPGEATLTLVQFDTEYEFVCRGLQIGKVPPYRLVPRGSTALLDAVGRSIVEAGARLAKLPEADRPGLVVFVIVTDGHENSSREFKKAQIKAMIEHQRSVYNWQFTFLGADDSAFDEAASMGISAGSSAPYAPAKMAEVYEATSAKLGRMRMQAAQSLPIDDSYTDEERKKMT
ncbi:MAG TPA: vWA domain-containing protein [Pirellulales bacterium]